METGSEIIKLIDETVENLFVTARFGNNWKDHIKARFEKGETDIDTIINIAWKQGRRAILMERAIHAMAESITKTDL